MIHDAQVEVTCDGKGCSYSEYVTLDYVFSDYSGERGEYNSSDSTIEETLNNDHDWVVIDGKHYCCQDCAEGQ